MSDKIRTQWNREKHRFEKRVNGEWVADPRPRKLMKKHKPEHVDYDAFMKAWLKSVKDGDNLNDFCEKYHWEGDVMWRKAGTTKDAINKRLRKVQDEAGIARHDQEQLPTLSTEIIPMPFTGDQMLIRLKEFYKKNPEIPVVYAETEPSNDEGTDTTTKTEKSKNEDSTAAK